MKSGVPNMKEIIPEPWMWRHLWLHTGTLLAALLAAYWKVAASLVMLDYRYRAYCSVMRFSPAIAVYSRTLKRIAKASP